MSAWTYTWESDWPFQVHRGPGPAIEVQLKATWSGAPDVTAEYLGTEVMQAELSPLQVRWSRSFFQPSPPQIVAPNGGGSARVVLALPWDRDFVRQIEEARARHPGDFDLRLNLRTHYRTLVPVDQRESRYSGYIGSNPLAHDSHGLSTRVSREQWLQALRTMGFSVFEVFEVEVRNAPRDKTFDRALRDLKEAESALRSGDWDGTVVKCRKACETLLASYDDTKPEPNLKAGAKALYDRLFPSTPNDPRREILDSLFHATTKLRHMGAHSKDPNVHVERKDAELALTITLPIFRFLGHALAAD